MPYYCIRRRCKIKITGKDDKGFPFTTCDECDFKKGKHSCFYLKFKTRGKTFYFGGQGAKDIDTRAFKR